jgi:hypothetical protein
MILNISEGLSGGFDQLSLSGIPFFHSKHEMASASIISFSPCNNKAFLILTQEISDSIAGLRLLQDYHSYSATFYTPFPGSQ